MRRACIPYKDGDAALPCSSPGLQLQTPLPGIPVKSHLGERKFGRCDQPDPKTRSGWCIMETEPDGQCPRKGVLIGEDHD
jgi:hypothetical protein